MLEWPSADTTDPPDPDDRGQAWCQDEPAFATWWRWTMAQADPLRVAANHRLFDRYAEAVPGRSAIEKLKSLGHLVEVGAGRGYWARILQEHGGSVAAYDRERQENPWAQVRVGGVDIIERYPGRPVFACWPYRPNGYMKELLHRARGRTIALVTAGLDNPIVGDALGDQLRAAWALDSTVHIPTWPLRGDTLTVWVSRRS